MNSKCAVLNDALSYDVNENGYKYDSPACLTKSILHKYILYNIMLHEIIQYSKK